MHTDDAAQRRIGEGDTVQVRSPYGQIALPVSLTAGIVLAPLPFRTAGAIRARAGGGWPIGPAVRT